MNITVYQVDAFTYQNSGGNPAGVVLNADNLTPQDMQNIAAQVRFSETAFVSKGQNCDFNVRFFTPNNEVDFCGHATLATFSLMFQQNLIEKKLYHQQTKAGKLAVNVSSNGYVEMNQAVPKFIGEISTVEVAATLNINEAILSVDKLPIEIVSTGLADIIIPVRHGYLDLIKPNLAKVSALSEKYQAIGMHLFELNKDPTEFTASCRNFAPLVGIPEESATGSACGALASYLTKHQVLASSQYHFEQGRAMHCTSSILCKIQGEALHINAVQVGGFATLIKTINIAG